MGEKLRGVIAAIPTPIDRAGDPDIGRLIAFARHLLGTGCDGLNLLGTTGEATSFTTAQRIHVMEGVAAAGLPLDRMMVGTGAAALEDAAALTARAGELGFSGALLLPPFYYKPLTADGVVRYIDRIAKITAPSELPLYLYNFPALSGVRYDPALVATLVMEFGSRIAGLKDSSGDIAHALEVAAISSGLSVFPSNEAILLRARAGEFAGCISATANLNAAHCARAYHVGDADALAKAVAIRGLFEGLPLVPGVKALVARALDDEAWEAMAPPLVELNAKEKACLIERATLIGS